MEVVDQLVEKQIMSFESVLNTTGLNRAHAASHNKSSAKAVSRRKRGFNTERQGHVLAAVTQQSNMINY